MKKIQKSCLEWAAYAQGYTHPYNYIHIHTTHKKAQKYWPLVINCSYNNVSSPHKYVHIHISFHFRFKLHYVQGISMTDVHTTDSRVAHDIDL